MPREYFVYIATNYSNKVLYTGVTNNVMRRMWEHKNKIKKGFTSKYKINKLVYVDIFESVFDAITAEKKIKGWTRAKKLDLIKSRNPKFSDLSLFA